MQILEQWEQTVRLQAYQLENERIRFFQPTGGQEEFLALCDPSAFIVISGAGNGWGKSELIAAIFAGAFWPNLMPTCFEKTFLKEWKHPKRARIYSSPAELEEIGSLQSSIKRLFPKGRYNYTNGRYSYPSIFETDTGWKMDMFSYERDASEAAGPNIGLQAFNEPPPQELWNEAIARARAGGYILGGMTSLRENIWIVDGILSRANGKDIRIRYGSSEENCKEHGKNGTLEHEQIEKILSQYDPDEREARRTGKPLRFSGRIYKTFSRNIHVSKSDIRPPENLDGVKFYMAVDPAIGKPFACIWAFVDHQGVVHIYDEYPNYDFEGAKDSNLTLRDYATIFKQKERVCGGRAIERIIDRHFANTRDIRGFTLKEQFAERDNGALDFIDSYKCQDAITSEVETGIITVKEYLRYNFSKPVDAINKPKIIISPKCLNTILSFERWTRDPDTQKPTDQYKDHADCVRYLLMADPKWERPRQWTPQHQPGYGVGIGG